MSALSVGVFEIWVPPLTTKLSSQPSGQSPFSTRCSPHAQFCQESLNHRPQNCQEPETSLVQCPVSVEENLA